MQAARARFRFDEYVALEARSEVKHEFLDGEVLAMAGGSPEHAALAGRLAVQLGRVLAGRGCEVFTSDLRVRVPHTGLATYPDLTWSLASGSAIPRTPRRSRIRCFWSRC
jgi:Uma2 family endonuclease